MDLWGVTDAGPCHVVIFVVTGVVLLKAFFVGIILPRLPWIFNRRRLQFSLRTLLLFVVVASPALAWLGNWYQRAFKNWQVVAEARRVTAEIQSKGGHAEWSVHYGSPGSWRYRPTWLENLFEDPSVPYNYSVSFDDDDMVLLQGMSELKTLYLTVSKITDAGLVYLKELMKLQELSLAMTQVTDAGLVHLKGLTNLRVLHLNGTHVTDTGVKDLQQALPDCKITHSDR